MARLLYQQDSTAQHKRLGRRHIRLCGQVPGAASFAQALQPKLDNLQQKELDRETAEKACENVQDDLVLKDAILDNAVRTLFEKARQYDRDNMAQVTIMLFPHLTFSDIINMPLADEPMKVTQLIEKLESLSEEHALHEQIGPLRQKTGDVNEALLARRNAVENLRKYQAYEELAKSDVRMQYEANYFDARKNLGKQIAEMIFPKVPRRKSSNPDEDTNPATEE